MTYFLDIPEITRIENFDLAELSKRWSEYNEYLESLRGQIPVEAFAFATAPWHYDFGDPRCPHDALVEEFSFRTEYAGYRLWQVGSSAKLRRLRTGHLNRRRLRAGYLGRRQSWPYLNLYVRLLGAYHDGQIELLYERVYGCALSSLFPETITPYPIGPGDWQYDEVRLSKRGMVMHEIRFSDVFWSIECKNIHYKWIPF